MECEYGASISLAIQRTDHACNDLRKALELAKKDDDPEVLGVLKDSLLSHQKAFVDLTKQKRRHEESCENCRVA